MSKAPPKVERSQLKQEMQSQTNAGGQSQGMMEQLQQKLMKLQQKQQQEQQRLQPESQPEASVNVAPGQNGVDGQLTLEALSGLQVNEAFPKGSELVVLEAAIMRSGEGLTSKRLARLEKDHRLQVLAYGSGRRLYAQDPTSGQHGWISYASQRDGQLLVAPSAGKEFQFQESTA